MFRFISLQMWFHVPQNTISVCCNSPARLLQRLFYFIAHETRPAIKQNIYFFLNFIACLVSCAINAAIYFIAAFILFYCT